MWTFNLMNIIQFFSKNEKECEGLFPHFLALCEPRVNVWNFAIFQDPKEHLLWF